MIRNQSLRSARSRQPALGHPSVETHPGSPACHLREGARFTPLDLVAPFAPTTIDNSYKAGVDALRLDWFEGMSCRITLLGAYLAQAGERFDVRGRDAALSRQQRQRWRCT